MRVYSLILVCCFALSLSAEPLYLSPVDVVLSEDGSTLYLACTTGNQIQVFDVKQEAVTAHVDIEAVQALALSPDGSRLFALAGEFKGRLLEIDTQNNKVMRSFPAGHTPMAPVMSADGKTLFYCNRFSRSDQPDVFAFDIPSGAIRASAKAIREPICMTLSKDGKFLWVVNHLPLMEANRDQVYASLNIYTSGDLKPVAKLDMPPGSFAIRDSALSHNGRYLFVSHTIGRFTVPTTHLDRGWINTSAISIFDAIDQRYVNTVLLDDTMQGAANPWGLTVTENDAWLCVNASGTHELIVIDMKEMFKRIENATIPK
ncbi:hypothetical protein ACFL6U_30210, partial [Planctomycetota bacterium]